MITPEMIEAATEAIHAEWIRGERFERDDFPRMAEAALSAVYSAIQDQAFVEAAEALEMKAEAATLEEDQVLRNAAIFVRSLAGRETP